MTRGDAPGATGYVLGDADVEVKRLLLQAQLYHDYTEHALRVAGLRAGMRVLDVGCGPGDVSFLAAGLVGPTGTVLGIDASDEIVALARARAAEKGVSTVSFDQSVISDIALAEPVDAVIGRLILMHLPDPVAALRHLATLVRPGGLIAICESDMTAVRSVPDIPLFRAVSDAITRAFRAVGLDPAFGTTLHAIFEHAGLDAPRLTLGAPVGGVNDTDTLAYGIEVWRLMLPVAQQLGLVTDELADLDTMLARLREELAANQAIVIMPAMITASTHLPGGSALR